MAFQANPLSLSMTNEAVGAWVKEGEAEEARARARAARAAKNPGGRASPPVRYKTPYLTVTDLQKPPKPWREFLCTDHPLKSYAFPRSFDDIKARLDGNVYEYIGNYVAAVFAVLCCVLYRKPKALAGGYAVLKIYAAAKRAPNGGRRDGFARKASDAIATVASWAIASYCNVALAVSYAVLIAFAIVVTHGAARRLDAPKPDWGKSPRRAKSHLGKLRLDG